MVRPLRWMFQRSALLNILTGITPIAMVSFTTVVNVSVCSLLIGENWFVVCFFMTFSLIMFLNMFLKFRLFSLRLL